MMLNKLTELQKALVAAALILLLGFGGGYYAKGKLDNRVVVKPPNSSELRTLIPAKVRPANWVGVN